MAKIYYDGEKIRIIRDVSERQSKAESLPDDAELKYKLSQDLETASRGLVELGSSIKNDDKIHVTAKQINAINRQFGSNISLRDIRKIRPSKLEKRELIADTFIDIGNIVLAGGYYSGHIAGVGAIERELQISFTSQTYSKSEFKNHRNLVFKNIKNIDNYHEVWWEDRYKHRCKHFYFPYQYRKKTDAEMRAERDVGHETALNMVRRWESREKKRQKHANEIINNIDNQVSNYLASNVKKPLFLDTETTGLYGRYQVIEIAIVDIDGEVIIDTLLHTKTPIDRGASRVHGINKKQLEKQPTFSEIEHIIERLLTGHEVWIFNLPFDYDGMVMSSSDNFSIDNIEFYCLMQHTMDKFQTERYISLASACNEMGVAGGSHRAISDALASVRLYRALSDRYGE